MCVHKERDNWNAGDMQPICNVETSQIICDKLTELAFCVNTDHWIIFLRKYFENWEIVMIFCSRSWEKHSCLVFSSVKFFEISKFETPLSVLPLLSVCKLVSHSTYTYDHTVSFLSHRNTSLAPTPSVSGKKWTRCGRSFSLFLQRHHRS